MKGIPANDFLDADFCPTHPRVGRDCIQVDVIALVKDTETEKFKFRLQNTFLQSTRIYEFFSDRKFLALKVEAAYERLMQVCSSQWC